MAGRAKLEAPRVEQNTANGWHPVQAQQSRDASRLRCGLGRVRALQGAVSDKKKQGASSAGALPRLAPAAPVKKHAGGLAGNI